MRSHRGPGLGSLPKKFPIAALDNSNVRYYPVSSIIRCSPYAAARICRNWIRTGPTGVSTGTTFNMSSIGIEMFTVNVDGWFDGFFFQAEDGIRDLTVTGVQTCALPI